MPYVQSRTGIASGMAGYCDRRMQSRPACGSRVTRVVPLYSDMGAYYKMSVAGV